MSQQLSLSEAMRGGAQLRPQAFGRMCDEAIDGTRSTCAWGAAFEGAGMSFDKDHPGDTRKLFASLFPVLEKQQETDCPHIYTGRRSFQCTVSQDLYLLIQHLNDDHRWTRERIADWLQGQGY